MFCNHLSGKNGWSVLLALLLLIPALSFAQIGQRKKSATERSDLRMVTEHLQFDEYHKAIPILDKLLSVDAENAHYNFWMGKCLYHTYKKNMALVFLDKANNIDPNVDKDLPYYYALALHYNYKFDEAADQYRKALENFRPKSPEYLEVSRRIAQCRYGKKALVDRNSDWDRIRINNCGDKINTPYSEHSPVISANDSILLYTARRPECLGAEPENAFYDEDVYISFKKGEVWTLGENIGTPVNSKGHDATINLTADGRTLYIYRHKKDGNLFVTNFDTTGKSWNEPQRLDKPFNSKYYEACIAVSPDGNLMLFSSDRPGGLGGRDLWMVRRMEDNRWSEPENLGPKVNTPFDDDSPFLHPDGKTLYYSSNGPNSIGGFDIYVTEYVETENTWLDPLNMGYPVNTPDEDIYFVLSQDGRTGYYASGKEGGFGEKDIYSIDFPYYPYPRRYFNIQLEGIVRDKETRDTLDATVRLMDKKTGEIFVSRVNKTSPRLFHFELKPEREYTLEVVADGFPLYSEEIKAPKLYGKDIRIYREIELEKPREIIAENGERFPEIMHIYYDFDKYDLREESVKELDRVISFLTAHPDWKVELHGHTDWYNTVDYNHTLGLNRSIIPMDYLVKQGVDPSRIIQYTFSENYPIDINDNDEGRQYNRRCEFHFIKEDKEVFASTRLRTGVTGVRVDHAPPQGRPGFDQPDKVRMLDAGTQPQASMHESGQAQTQSWVASRQPLRMRIHLVD